MIMGNNFERLRAKEIQRRIAKSGKSLKKLSLPTCSGQKPGTHCASMKSRSRLKCTNQNCETWTMRIVGEKNLSEICDAHIEEQLEAYEQELEEMDAEELLGEYLEKEEDIQ